MGRKASHGLRKDRAEKLAVLGKTYPLSAAILARDEPVLCELLSGFGIGKVVGVQVEKAAGEQFTGGVSCPVHSLLCTVEGSSEPVPLIAKVAEVVENDERRRAIKCRTYHVEKQFYKVASYALNIKCAAIPKLLGSELPKDNLSNVHTLVMTDLKPAFPFHPESLTMPVAQAAVRWLAALHSSFWATVNTLPGLWENGSFWDLQKDGEQTIHKIGPNWAQTMKWLGKKHPQLANEEGIKSVGVRLEAAAIPISNLMNGHTCKGSRKNFRTIIHGDAKAANMFFETSCETPRAAVCDFQYAGEGYGAADLAYLLYPDARSDFFGQEDEILAHYHENLMAHLNFRGVTYTFEVLKRQYELAQIDFFRHHVAKSGWVACCDRDVQLILRMEAILASLDGGSLMSPMQYDAKIVAEFA